MRRRFDVHIKTENLMFIDDYAHHPEELKLLIDSLKMMFPDKKLIAIFQPHLFSEQRILELNLVNSFLVLMNYICSPFMLQEKKKSLVYLVNGCLQRLI